MKVEVISNLISDGCRCSDENRKKALHYFDEACSAMLKLSQTMDITDFQKADSSHRWTKRLLDCLPKTETGPIFDESDFELYFEANGALKREKIQRQLHICENLLDLWAGHAKTSSKIHILMAQMLYNPDDLFEYDYHYRVATELTPKCGESYLHWAAPFEAESSSKKRYHAIEIYERALKVRTFSDSMSDRSIRTEILRRLVNRCRKDRQYELAQAYGSQLLELVLK